jgi:hypothetical protein
MQKFKILILISLTSKNKSYKDKQILSVKANITTDISSAQGNIYILFNTSQIFLNFRHFSGKV